jgi:general secretion pathway protein D
MLLKFRIKNLAASAAIASVALLSTVASAQGIGGNDRFDLRLDSANLQAALSALSLQTGIEYVVEPTDKEFRPVTLHIVGKTPDQALEAIVTAAGAEAELSPSGFYIIRMAGSKEEEPKPEPVETVEVPIVVESIKLMKADPRDVITLLKGDEIDIANPFRYTKTSLDRSKNRSYGLARPLTVVDQGRVIDPGTESYGSGVNLPGEASNQVGGVGQGGGLGQGGGGIGQGGGGLGQGGTGTGQGGIGVTGGDGFIPEGIESISYNPTDNSIIVQGPEEDIAELERLIQRFDVAPKQVVIEVEFITTTNSDNRSLGIDWLYQRGTTFAGVRPGSFARQNDPVFINYATGNVSTRLRTLMSNNYGRVVNAPLVRTLNNTPAFISQGTVTTIFLNQIVSTGGAVTIVSQPEPVQVTTSLNVTPRINNDGTITVAISTAIEDFGAITRGPEGQEVPDQLFQQIGVVARVKDGETIALGGFTRKQDSYSVSKIPVLAELPIIGQLFRNRNTIENNSELIIFVTPSIVDEDDYGLTP